jgi:hypothetical protein
MNQQSAEEYDAAKQKELHAGCAGPPESATGHPSPLAYSERRVVPAAPASVLRLRDATVTLRRARRGYRGLFASASLSLAHRSS